MGWSIKEISGDENIHSLIYGIMEAADSRRGENAALYAGKYIYRHLKLDKGLSACLEGEKEPCGMLLFSKNELKFLYVVQCELQQEIAHSLLEQALNMQKREDDSRFIFSTFPDWNDTLGQDILSPYLKDQCFKELHIIKMIAPIESQRLEEYFAMDHLRQLKSAGYSFGGWKKKEHLDATSLLLLENPPPLIGALFAHSPVETGVDWIKERLCAGETGRELHYPTECSTVALSNGLVAGALLCEEKGWISQVVVRKGHENRGIARAMMQRAYRALKVLEAKEMALKVFEENPIALDWYERIGFSSGSKHPVWVWRVETDKGHQATLPVAPGGAPANIADS